MRLFEFYQEEPGGSFTHDGDEYLLNPLLQYTRTFPIETIPVDDLKWIIDKEEPFDYADTSVPILVTSWNGKLVVIDGYHRLLKAVHGGLENLPARMVSTDLLNRYRK